MNQNNIQQFLLFKYFIETIQKQQNTKSNDVLKEFSHQSIQQNQEHPINISPTLTNSISSKKDYQSEGSDINHDDAYWERRRKNNEAAKRSRNARRVKEDEIALRAALLEQENVKLRLENVHLKQENIKLRYQISTSTDST